MNPCAALGSLDSHACDEASPTSPAPHPRGPRGVSRRLVPAPSRCCAGPRETETQHLVRVGAERGLHDRGGFLEEDAFGQGRAGSGERRGRSRAAGATGWLLPRRGGVEVRDRDGGAWPGRRGNRRGESFSMEGDFLLCCEGGGGKTAKSFSFWSRHSDVRRPGQSFSFPGLPAKRQTGSFSYRCLPLPSLEAGNPRSEQGRPSPGLSPGRADGRLLPAPSQGRPLCLCPHLLLLQGPPVLWDQGPA